MNYQKIYDTICKRGQERILPKDVYTEKHHIVPKCLGGGNEKSNLTVLTAREHFLVHYILTRIYPNNSKIWNAMKKMLYYKSAGQLRYIPNSKMFEMIRSEINKQFSGTGNPFFGKKHTEETKQILSLKHIGRFCGPKSPKYGIAVSDETKSKISNANKGKTRTNEFKIKLSEKMKGEKNHFYGKTHSMETIEIIKFKRSLQIITNDTKAKIKSSMEGEKNHFYGKTHSMETIGRLRKNRKNSKPCKINEIQYISVNDASRKLMIPAHGIRARLNSLKPEWENWTYI